MMLYDEHADALRALGLTSHRSLLALPLAVVAWTCGADDEIASRYAGELISEYFGFGEEERKETRAWLAKHPGPKYVQEGMAELRRMVSDPGEPLVQQRDAIEALLLSETVGHAVLRGRPEAERKEKTHQVQEAVQLMAQQLGVDVGDTWDSVLEQLGQELDLAPSDELRVDVAGQKGPPVVPSPAPGAKRVSLPVRAIRAAVRQRSRLFQNEVTEPRGGLV